jgi:hypothetical protein
MSVAAGWARGLGEGAGGGALNTANVLTFGGVDAAGDYVMGSDDWRVWRDGADYASGKVAATIGREVLITAATLGTAQIARGGVAGSSWSARVINAGASSRHVYQASRAASAGLTVYDSISGAYHIGHGVNEVYDGNHWGWLEIAGGGLSIFGSAASVRELRQPQLGGAFGDLDKTLGDRHHSPAQAVIRVMGGDANRSPAFLMSATDHVKTASYAGSAPARAYRAQQRALAVRQAILPAQCGWMFKISSTIRE